MNDIVDINSDMALETYSEPLETTKQLVEQNIVQTYIVPDMREEWEKTSTNKTALDVVNEKEQELLLSDNVGKFANIIGQEKIKADLAGKAAEIKAKNIKTAEEEFETETRAKRLKQAIAKLELEHRYEMSIINENGKHYAMLDKRKKMHEKYIHLYGENEVFCYSNIINKIKSITHSLSKLDKTIKQILKILLFVGVIIGGIILLNYFNII